MEEEDYIKEGDIKGHVKKSNLDIIKNITKQMEESICKIDGTEYYGSGFFCILQDLKDWNSPLIYTLMTNNHVLGKEDIQINKTIKISLNNGEKNLEIRIDDSRKKYTSKV